MEDSTAPTGLTADADKSPERIESEMELTRESITQKVAALETQVLGTIQSATNTLTDTVQSVKDAPAAVRESVQETVAAVRESVKETISSVRESVAAFSVSDCVRDNPTAALGTSFAGGFLTGFLLLGGRESRPIMARGAREPAPEGRQGSVPPGYSAYSADPGPARSAGMFAGLIKMVGGELEQLARQALSTAIASLKQSVNDKVPKLMDDAVQSFTSRVTGQDTPAHARGNGNPAAAGF